ncbi:hypothetical protein EVAR_71887_1 [Eumeta japonica]|uniref:Uncharacterized protein n=1 Tax=Eumeta variegata TaxID=151549 RepID=A0A4C1SFN3_EUMVA|nr:hypothetical protein EVAR_71887_1 [Eumeta japonica]
MQFFLYKRDFPECGREMRTDDEKAFHCQFNADHPTRGFESTDELSSISEMSAAYRHAERLSKNNYKGLLN